MKKVVKREKNERSGGISSRLYPIVDAVSVEIYLFTNPIKTHDKKFNSSQGGGLVGPVQSCHILIRQTLIPRDQVWKSKLLRKCFQQSLLD